MNPPRLKEKYGLPSTIRITIEHENGSYYVDLPDYPGCITQEDRKSELFVTITDAILSYFEVPQQEARQVNAVYLPEFILRVKSRTPLTGEFQLKYFYFSTSIPVHFIDTITTIASFDQHEIIKALENLGFIVSVDRGKGSHTIAKHSTKTPPLQSHQRPIITIPHKPGLVPPMRKKIIAQIVAFGLSEKEVHRALKLKK